MARTSQPSLRSVRNGEGSCLRHERVDPATAQHKSEHQGHDLLLLVPLAAGGYFLRPIRDKYLDPSYKPSM